MGNLQTAIDGLAGAGAAGIHETLRGRRTCGSDSHCSHRHGLLSLDLVWEQAEPMFVGRVSCHSNVRIVIRRASQRNRYLPCIDQRFAPSAQQVIWEQGAMGYVELENVGGYGWMR
jgi:hypothetical protein